MRVTTLEKSVNESTNEDVEIEGDDGWVQTHVGYKKVEEEDIPEIGVDDVEGEKEKPPKTTPKPEEKKNSDDDIPDMDDFSMDDNLDEDDPVSNFTYHVIIILRI